MTWLLDGNTLVAPAVDTHIFHERTREWFDAMSEPFATCAVTEGTLLRVYMKIVSNSSPALAWSALRIIHAMRDHEFWDDGFSYLQVASSPLSGPSQFTDAWLAELARRKSAKLATLDRRLVSLHGDVGFLIPDAPTSATP